MALGCTHWLLNQTTQVKARPRVMVTVPTFAAAAAPSVRGLAKGSKARNCALFCGGLWKKRAHDTKKNVAVDH